jgi:hypothetical protein
MDQAQEYPMYATDDQGHRYLVIGWSRAPHTGNQLWPMLAPIDRRGAAQAWNPIEHFRYSLEPEAAKSPTDAETEIIQRNPNLSPVRPRVGWVR